MGGGLGDPRPGRVAIEWNRNGVLESTFLVMRATDRGNFGKIAKKNSVFRVHAAINFRFSPMLIQFWKALGRPRRMVVPSRHLSATVEALLAGQRSIFPTFFR